MVTDQKRVANKFNDFFINVAQKLVERMGKSNRTINDYLLNPIKNNVSKARRCSRCSSWTNQKQVMYTAYL